MKVKKFIPEPAAISREAITLIGGAIVAAAVLTYLAPGLKAWLAKNLPWVKSQPV
jgi:hypothetical protein